MISTSNGLFQSVLQLNDNVSVIRFLFGTKVGGLVNKVIPKGESQRQ